MDPTQLARLARQSAMTSRLLGVDFVPAYIAGVTGRRIEMDEVEEREAPEIRVVARDLMEAAPASAPDASIRFSVPPAGTRTDEGGSRPAAIAKMRDDAPIPPIARVTPRTIDTHDDDLFGDATPRPLRSEPRADLAAAAPPEMTREQAILALNELRERYIADAPHAPFIKSFNNIVFGEGDPKAGLCFVGEAPGEEEDKQGRPFVGRAGQLLDKMITAMGLKREQVYICNVLKVRPPDNATPTIEEAAASRPYLMQQLDIIAPKVIVTLGKSASNCLLASNEAMNAMRGSWRQLRLPSGRTIPVMPTFHPAYLLRSYTEENRKKVWSDLKLAMTKLTKREA